jgi:peptidoglycan hydrolase CwlO-like protein
MTDKPDNKELRELIENKKTIEAYLIFEDGAVEKAIAQARQEGREQGLLGNLGKLRTEIEKLRKQVEIQSSKELMGKVLLEQEDALRDLETENTEKDSIICNLRSDIKELEDEQDELNETNRNLYSTNVELEAENAKLRKSRDRLAENLAERTLWTDKDRNKDKVKQNWIDWSEEKE